MQTVSKDFSFHLT